MSLGFTPLKPRRHMTNLAGSTGSTVGTVYRQRRKYFSDNTFTDQTLDPAPTAVYTKHVSASSRNTNDEHVFATAFNLRDEGGDLLAKDGERVLAVYPMSQQGDQVYMRIKSADPVTGQLSYKNAIVYDAKNESRHLIDFHVDPAYRPCN